MTKQSEYYFDVLFDGPPGHLPGRFIDCLDEQGRGLGIGKWVDNGDGTWALRIPRPAGPLSEPALADRINAMAWPDEVLDRSAFRKVIDDAFEALNRVSVEATQVNK